MKLRKIAKNLTLWVLLAIVAGALLGHFEPATGVKMEFLGKRFIEVVKLFINPIIFLTITLGISTMGDLKKVGRIGGKALLYFEIVTTLALFIGVAVAAVVRPGDGVSVGKLSTDKVGEFTKRAGAFSWGHFLADNLTLQVLLIAIVLGIVLSKYAGRKPIIHFLKEASKYVFRGLHWVMMLAPIGDASATATTIAEKPISFSICFFAFGPTA